MRIRRALAAAAAALLGCASTAPAPWGPEVFEEVLAHYRTLPARKALAVAGDPHDPNAVWAFGFGHGFATDAEARDAALAGCVDERAARKVEPPCGLYAVGDLR